MHVVSEVGDCAEWGWLTLMRAGIWPDLSECERAAREAMDLARRFGDRDPEFDALSYLNEALVFLGRIAERMGHLDEAMVAATRGEVHGST